MEPLAALGTAYSEVTKLGAEPGRFYSGNDGRGLESNSLRMWELGSLYSVSPIEVTS